MDRETACENDRQRERGAVAPLVYFAKYKTETVSIFTHIPFSNGRFPISLEYKELMLSKSEPRLSLYFLKQHGILLNVRNHHSYNHRSCHIR